MTDSVIVTNDEPTYVVENVGVVGPPGDQTIPLVAPVTPANGDIWAEGSVLKVHLGGVTYNVALTPA